jgi:hypothetical protein
MLKWLEDVREGLTSGYTRVLVLEIAASAMLLASFITLCLVILFDSYRGWLGLKGVAAVGLCSLVARAAVLLWSYHRSGRSGDAQRI